MMLGLGALLSLGAGRWPGRLGQSPNDPPAKTYYRDVLPILQRHCQACHRPQGIAPMALESYSQAKNNAQAIQNSVEARSMPPWFADPAVGRFLNDPSLSAEEIAVISEWVETGAVAGRPSEAPAPVAWAESWSIPRPDLILRMPQPAALPARGDIDYIYEIVPTRFAEDRWVRAAELLPSAPANVHHAVVYVRPPDANWLRHAPVGVPFTAESLEDPEDRRGAHWTDSDILLVYAPGSSPDDFPATMAKLVPAGSDLVFQMHYTSSGKPEQDRSALGLDFVRGAPPERVLTLQLTNDHFVIPPGAPNYRVEARGTLPNDALLLGFMPHMHLRGKRFEYNIVHRRAARGTQADPVGTSELEPLLRVNYHFHWQMSYRLAEPRWLKAGTELQAVAWFDNSSGNPHNPDPTAAVGWGEQTTEEMMVGFFDVAVARDTDKKRFFTRPAQQTQ
jgi:hypothetical protein